MHARTGWMPELIADRRGKPVFNNKQYRISLTPFRGLILDSAFDQTHPQLTRGSSSIYPLPEIPVLGQPAVEFMSGTSMATPIVTAVIARMLMPAAASRRYSETKYGHCNSEFRPH